jgi:hypothetical protein
MQYRVEWVIEIDADTAREAAEKALIIQRSDSQAVVFDVLDEEGETERIDLLESPEDRGRDALVGIEEYLVCQRDLIQLGLRRLSNERYMPMVVRRGLEAEGYQRLDAYGQALDMVRDRLREASHPQ